MLGDIRQVKMYINFFPFFYTTLIFKYKILENATNSQKTGQWFPGYRVEMAMCEGGITQGQN